MSLTLDDTITVSPEPVEQSNNDVTVTLTFKGLITRSSDNPVKMEIRLSEEEKHVSFLDKDDELVTSCSWDQDFTMLEEEHTKEIVVRVLNAPAQEALCDFDLTGKPQGSQPVKRSGSFKFSR